MPVTNPLARMPLLRPVPIFRGLSKQALLQVARRATEQTYPAGSVVVQQGEPGDTLCIVTQGTVEVVRDEHAVTRMTAGDYFGEISLIDGGPRSATVVAVDDVSVLVISGADFAGLLADPYVAQATIRNLATRVREAHAAHGPECL
jgi:CRP-like cAMP-binding protein